MSTIDALLAAVRGLGEHKLRTTLTMLGMMFGVAAVIAMLSIGAGAEERALAMIDRLGMRNVIVDGKKLPGLSHRDVEAIMDAIPDVELTAPRIEIDAYRLIAGGARTHARVFGVTASHAEV